jgi:hypothetical protein
VKTRFQSLPFKYATCSATPWTAEVETAFEKMQSQVIKMYELAFNRYNGVCEKCGRAGGSSKVRGAAEPADLRMISCGRCRAACWCSEQCKYQDAERHAASCQRRDEKESAANRPLHRALSGMDKDGRGVLSLALHNRPLT